MRSKVALRSLMSFLSSSLTQHAQDCARSAPPQLGTAGAAAPPAAKKQRGSSKTVTTSTGVAGHVQIPPASLCALADVATGARHAWHHPSQHYHVPGYCSVPTTCYAGWVAIPRHRTATPLQLQAHLRVNCMLCAPALPLTCRHRSDQAVWRCRGHTSQAVSGAAVCGTPEQQPCRHPGACQATSSWQPCSEHW
jgi:hypothetical protein